MKIFYSKQGLIFLKPVHEQLACKFHFIILTYYLGCQLFGLSQISELYEAQCRLSDERGFQ